MPIIKPTEFSAPVFFPKNDYSIVKYLDLTKFVSLLHKQSLFFCRLDKLEDKFEGTTAISSVKKTTEELLKTANLFLNAPYLWGGKSVFGIDCSGFTQLVYKLNGYKIQLQMHLVVRV